jgi:hypothetical protein
MEEKIKLTFTAVNQATATFRAIENQMGQIQSRVLNLQTAMVTVFGGVTIAKMGSDFLSTARLLENLELRMNAAAGSVKAGNKAFEEAASIAKQVPYEYEDIIQSAVNLRGVLTRDPENFKMYMQVITDLAAYTGFSIEETTSNIIRMYSAGAGAADGFRDKGVLAMLGFKAGVSYTAEETMDKLIYEYERAGSKFKGLASNLGENVDGMWSMVLDRYFDYRRKVMDAGPSDMVKVALQEVLDITAELDANGTLDVWAEAAGYNIVQVAKTASMSMAEVIDFVRTNSSEFENGIIGYLLYGKNGALVAYGLSSIGIDLQQAMSNIFTQIDAYKKGYLSMSEMIFDVSNKSVSDKLKARGYYFDSAAEMDNLGLGEIRQDIQNTIDQITELEAYLAKNPLQRLFGSRPESVGAFDNIDDVQKTIEELKQRRNDLQSLYYSIVETGENPEIKSDTSPDETLVADKVKSIIERLESAINTKKGSFRAPESPTLDNKMVLSDKEQLKIDEARLSYQIQAAEKIKDKNTSLQLQKVLNEDLLEVEQKKLHAINETTDPDKYYKQMAAVDELKGKIGELTIAMDAQNQTMTDGFQEGMDNYLSTAKSGFDKAVSIAEDTAKGMEGAFSEFYFDAVRGQMDSLFDYVNMFLRAIEQSFTQVLAQGTVQGLMGYFSPSPTSYPTVPEVGAPSQPAMSVPKVNEDIYPRTPSVDTTARSLITSKGDTFVNLTNESGMPLQVADTSTDVQLDRTIVNVILKDYAQGGDISKLLQRRG